MEDKFAEDKDNLITDLLLTFHQDKRNALSMIRIGITTFIAQVSILSFMIVTSRYYHLMEIMHLVIPFILLNLVIFGIAGYLICRSILRIHQLDSRIMKYTKLNGVDE